MAVGDKASEPVLGIPYAYANPSPNPNLGVGGQTTMAPPPFQQVYYGYQNPYQAGMIPPNAIFDVAPHGIPLRETLFRDTPAPFECSNCGKTGLTDVKSKPSLAACVACMMSFCVGVCFLCPGMDCLWHKEHYCANCGHKVAEFKKSDPCVVVDATQWTQPSFAVPA